MKRQVDPAALRGDRVVRPFARVAGRAAASLAAWPIVAGEAAFEAVAARVARGDRHHTPPPLPTPTTDFTRAAATIRALTPASGPGSIARARLAGMHDWPLMVLTARPSLAQLGYGFPRAFRTLVLDGDGVPVSCVVGRHGDAGRPAVIVVHGAMTTKGFDYVRRACLRLFERGFDVLAPDLRGFGGTALASPVPTSLGWAEGGDVLALAAWLRATGATRVGALGFSLGGAAVLAAAARTAESPPGLDGGVLALAPPADLEQALRRLSRRPPVTDLLFPTWLTLATAATARCRSEGRAVGWVTPWRAVSILSEPHYGMSARELAHRASPARFAAEISVPTFCLFADRDPIVPVAHATALADAAAANPALSVHVVEAAAHAAFDLVAPRYAASVEEAWFGGTSASATTSARAARTPIS